MLVLFDVDKTLFMNSDPLMGQATTDAIETVWGRRLAQDAIKHVDHAGQTATRITRLLLRQRACSTRRSMTVSRAGARTPPPATSSCSPKPTRATGAPRRDG